MGGATLKQGLNRSATQAHAAALVLAEIKPDERVVADPRVLDRLRLAGLAEGRLSSCLDADPPLGTAFWWVRLQPLDQPLDLRGCSEPSGALPQRDLSGWAPTRAWTEGPPEHERGAASFLMPAVVLRYGPDPGPGPQALSLAVRRAPLDGMAGSGLVLRDLQRPDQPPTYHEFHENEPMDFIVGDRDKLGAVEVRVRPPHRPGLPRLSLLDPLRQDVQQWEPVLVPVASAPTPVLLPALALQSPWLQVCRRAAAAVLALLLGLAAGWPRRAGSS